MQRSIKSIADLVTAFNTTFNISGAFNNVCQSSVTLFVFINPVGSIALVISMTSIMDASERMLF
jgi:hypothetical protein